MHATVFRRFQNPPGRGKNVYPFVEARSDQHCRASLHPDQGADHLQCHALSYWSEADVAFVRDRVPTVPVPFCDDHLSDPGMDYLAELHGLSYVVLDPANGYDALHYPCHVDARLVRVSIDYFET